MTLATMLADCLEKWLSWDHAVPALMSIVTGFSMLGIASLLGGAIHFWSVVLGIALFAVVRGVFNMGIKVWGDDNDSTGGRRDR